MRNNCHWHYTSRKSDWVLFLISHGVLCQYILSCGEDMLSVQLVQQSINVWHGVFICLSNSFLLPLHHWGFLLWILYRASIAWTVPEAVLRFADWDIWFRRTVADALKIALGLVMLNLLSTILGCVLRYGFPTSFAWGSTALVPTSIQNVFLIALFARILVSLSVSLFYLMLIIHFRKKVFAAGITLLLLMLADWVLMETPSYFSFKPLLFTSSFSFYYFVNGTFLSNLILSYGTSLITSLLLYYLCVVQLRKKRWRLS